jgi:bifunctional DNA-binding transcriptional regulator/antitoxin component of YhaV-PrlF toxin-antitoxin module
LNLPKDAIDALKLAKGERLLVYVQGRKIIMERPPP